MQNIVPKIILMAGVLFCDFFIVVKVSHAQNLVPNFSFEEKILCPEDRYFGQSEWPVRDWFNGSSGTPDLYHRCTGGKVSVPDNWAGNTQPVHGDAYMGIYLWGKDTDYREYLSVKLKTPLEAGKKYYFEAYYQIAFFSHYVTGNIGAVVSRQSKKGEMAGAIHLKPQVAVRKEDALEGDVFKWEKLEGEFVAEGGEQYLMIGNFDDKALTSRSEIFVNAMKEFELIGRAYAYIDHVRLWKEGTVEPADLAFDDPEPEKFILSDINFEFDKYQLKDTAKTVLTPLVDYLKQRSEGSYILLVSGYTDDKGSPEYNLRLSTARARAVATFLYRSGIPKNLLKVFGKGESDPILPNDSEENRQKNRRVEIIIREVSRL